MNTVTTTKNKTTTYNKNMFNKHQYMNYKTCSKLPLWSAWFRQTLKQKNCT